ncbi:MAG TPA: antitoxin [Candidatus Stackebrandtia excrementipullorum]|nr:antitoxin [Candidatus Stackebrandtia excrementipullorum]
MIADGNADYEGQNSMGISDKFEEFKGKAKGKAEELKGEMKGKKAEGAGHAKGKKAEGAGHAKGKKAEGEGKMSKAGNKSGHSSNNPIDKAADFVNEKTDNKYSDKVDKIGDKAKNMTGKNR